VPAGAPHWRNFDAGDRLNRDSSVALWGLTLADLTVFYSGPLVTAREAFDQGHTRYFTGIPCIHGHVAQRMVSNGVCIECLRARNYANLKNWRSKNKKAIAGQAKRYRAKHPDKISAIKKRYRELHLDEVRHREREAARIRRTDREKEQARLERWRQRREARLALQAGRSRPSGCDLCGGHRGGIVFDHCHQSGDFRGWLCDRCNKILGLVKDSPTLLRRMARYLERSNGKANSSAEEQLLLTV
jgi:hypothetical protein